MQTDRARAWPATRAASCSAADSGRTASARSGYIGSIMCPSYASDHHRSMPAPEPILHRATKHVCMYEVLAALTTYPRSAALVRVPLLAWPSLIRRLEVPCTSGKRANRPITTEGFRTQRRRVRGTILQVSTAPVVHRLCRFRSKATHLTLQPPAALTPGHSAAAKAGAALAMRRHRRRGNRQ